MLPGMKPRPVRPYPDLLNLYSKFSTVGPRAVERYLNL
eukprot:SAG31_NODE_18601_length_630_cov_0.772128_2_plen_37_part_01